MSRREGAVSNEQSRLMALFGAVRVQRLTYNVASMPGCLPLAVIELLLATWIRSSGPAAWHSIEQTGSNDRVTFLRRRQPQTMRMPRR